MAAGYPGLAPMIPVIDLFAGPGGLGEGFSAYRDRSGRRMFRIALSIEKDADAHQTLRLRSFFRQFGGHEVPEEYYDFLRQKLALETLYARFPCQAEASAKEAWLAELGGTEFPPETVDTRIQQALRGSSQWVLIGGPPCQAYSLVGRSRMIPRNRARYEKDHRHFLYREYLRILAVHRPPIFVLENVKGILSSKVGGALIIEKILDDLKRPSKAHPEVADARGRQLEYDIYPMSSYGETSTLFEIADTRPADYIVRCELHGIPQARHRLILLGVRKGQTNTVPGKLKICSKTVDLWDVIKDLPKIRSRISGDQDSAEIWAESVSQLLAQKELQNDSCSDLKLELQRNVKKLHAVRDTGGEYVVSRGPQWNSDWYRDSKLQGVCNHSARSHMKQDLWRYFFAACYATCTGSSPRLRDFPPLLLPEHRNLRRILRGEEPGFADRFRVQVKGHPSTTITSHIAKDGHYFIHPDAAQCRSLTVREAARLQTFPDNYFFTGPRTSQYQQVGNAVPPLLAYQIAQLVHQVLQTV